MELGVHEDPDAGASGGMVYRREEAELPASSSQGAGFRCRFRKDDHAGLFAWGRMRR